MTPIPVYITDCVGDCLVIAQEARSLAETALTVGVVGFALALVSLGAIWIATGYRR